ncbi:MAG: murein DD-endopeptidase MepM/ murein hydrolase activator NlpD [Polyangiales bacterium]|jgi:murein DD-endopeptidase MepM/ murein hydrolase activator NlpD
MDSRFNALLWLGCLCLVFTTPAMAEDERNEGDAEEEAEVSASEAQADADEDAEEDAPRRFDYSRFSDGPRHVPRPRGASAARAERLGLGTRNAASRLMRSRPLARWVDAAGDSMPEHLRWPVELGRFGRGFGLVRRRRPELPHRGVDIVADEGSVIRAVAPGIVAYSDNGVRGFGNTIIIVHPSGEVSIYAHCARTTVQAGWRVRQGERIGFVGNTGISRGPHLHFELHRRGHAVNPLSRFDGRPWIAAYREWTRLKRAGRYNEPTGFLVGALPSDGPSGVAAPSAPQATVRGDDREGLADARRLLASGATSVDLESVEGGLFSTALWPVRGGQRGGDYIQARGVNISGDLNAPIRVVADGRVIYAGVGLRGVGKAIVVLHKNGWVTLYGSAESIHVEAGQHVQRGEWIGRVGTSAGGETHLHFQLRHEGHTLRPDPLFVGAP